MDVQIPRIKNEKIARTLVPRIIAESVMRLGFILE
jgi:hypothetical protein